MPQPNDDAWVRLGVVARAHGVRGALKVKLDHPESKTLRPGLSIRLGADAHRVARYAAGVLTLEGVEQREGADALKGREITVRRGDFLDHSTYLVDLVGAPVQDEAGASLGVVKGFLDNGAHPLIVVARPGAGAAAEVMVPYVAALVREASPTRIVLRPPRGLFDDDAVVDTPEPGDADDGAADDEEPAP